MHKARISKRVYLICYQADDEFLYVMMTLSAERCRGLEADCIYLCCLYTRKKTEKVDTSKDNLINGATMKKSYNFK